MKSKLSFLLIIIVIFLLLLTACGSQSQQQKTSKSENEIIKKKDVSQDNLEEEIENIEKEYKKDNLEANKNKSNFYNAVSPFTGLPIERQYYKHSVAVSIENSPAARPQSGLDEAEIVYEFMLEGGITRFLAIFWPEVPKKIGPIRSARPVMIETAKLYDAVFLHAGASPDGFALLANDNLRHLDQIYQSKYFWRSSKKRAPHNLYSGEDLLSDFLTKLPGKEYPEQFNFLKASVISDFKEAKDITIDYWGSYGVIYLYNSLQNNYKRFLNNKNNPHLTEGGKEISPQNVIVQYAKTSTKDDQGRQKIDFRSGGKMELFRDGLVIVGSWKNENGRIIYLNSKGKQIEINPGQTFIQVVPNGTEVSY